MHIQKPGAVEPLRTDLVALSNMAIANLPAMYRFRNVCEATREVVNGVRYALLVNVTDPTGADQLCEIIVLERPWMLDGEHDKQRELLHSNCTAMDAGADVAPVPANANAAQDFNFNPLFINQGQTDDFLRALEQQIVPPKTRATKKPTHLVTKPPRVDPTETAFDQALRLMEIMEMSQERKEVERQPNPEGTTANEERRAGGIDVVDCPHLMNREVDSEQSGHSMDVANSGTEATARETTSETLATETNVVSAPAAADPTESTEHEQIHTELAHTTANTVTTTHVANSEPFQTKPTAEVVLPQTPDVSMGTNVEPVGPSSATEGELTDTQKIVLDTFFKDDYMDAQTPHVTQTTPINSAAAAVIEPLVQQPTPTTAADAAVKLERRKRATAVTERDQLTGFVRSALRQLDHADADDKRRVLIEVLRSKRFDFETHSRIVVQALSGLSDCAERTDVDDVNEDVVVADFDAACAHLLVPDSERICNLEVHKHKRTQTYAVRQVSWRSVWFSVVSLLHRILRIKYKHTYARIENCCSHIFAQLLATNTEEERDESEILRDTHLYPRPLLIWPSTFLSLVR